VISRFFGRPKAKRAQAALRTGARRPEQKHFPKGVTCGAGCGKTVGNRCSYTDMTGQRCTYWCRDHSVFLNDRIWCERHANSVKWLRARDGTIYEIGSNAAINDRSPNLVGILVDELNPKMTAYLSDCFKRHRGVHIVTDAHVRTASIPRGRVEHTPDGPLVLQESGHTAWERGWGVYSHVGYLARVVLRVTATEPPVVHVYANGMLVLRRVPDWIRNRGKGTDPKQDHAVFRGAVMSAVKEVVFVPEPDLDD
jgi:hypothetical protein